MREPGLESALGVGDEIGVTFRGGAERRVEDGAEDAGDLGPHRGVGTAGLGTHEPGLVSEELRDRGEVADLRVLRIRSA